MFRACRATLLLILIMVGVRVCPLCMCVVRLCAKSFLPQLNVNICPDCLYYAVLGELLDMKAAYAIDEDGVKIMSPAKRRRVARNRWHLAVVLMQNPSLVKDRRTVKDDDDRGDSTEPTSEVSDVEMDV
eukprot:m.237131 g.237131  ORF g.237131 m.237131 type:complete len:129 (-) comp15268_c1_seq6:1425-1811(-)